MQLRGLCLIAGREAPGGNDLNAYGCQRTETRRPASSHPIGSDRGNELAHRGAVDDAGSYEEVRAGPDPAIFRIFHEVVAAGRCRHPIHLVALGVDKDTGEILTTNDVRIACKDRRAILCPSCAAVYKADAWFLVTAGLAGGKGMPETLAEHPRLFLTLTAPSFGEVHTITDDGSCHPKRRRGCDHGRSRTCATKHDADDNVLGSPLCDECFEWEEAVLWNAAASRLWNRTIERVRRLLASQQRIGLATLRTQATIHYLRVAETQRRGLVHFHVVLRADGPEPASRPPPWLTVDAFARAVRRAVATTTVPNGMGDAAWGTQLELVDLGAEHADAARVAGYVAKYATKTTDDDFGLARRFRDQHDLELARTSRHFKRLAQCAWELGGRPELEALRLREHAHTLGFTGQLLTKSRGFSTTFGVLRAARASYAASDDEFEPAPPDASYAYVDRGYSDPRAETLTELLIGWDAEDRKERRLRRLEQQGNAESTPPRTTE